MMFGRGDLPTGQLLHPEIVAAIAPVPIVLRKSRRFIEPHLVCKIENLIFLCILKA
jgi:hypothetical protein